MATKSRRRHQKKQSLSKREKDVARKNKQRAKLDKEYARQRKALDRSYRKKLAQLEAIGAYQPENKRLTKARKAAINRKFGQFEEFLRGDFYVYVPIPTRSKKQLKKTLKLAKQNQLPVSQKGVFVPKTKNTKSAKAVYSKKTKTYRIKISKVKTGPTGKKRVTEVIPIEPMGTLEQELDRIRDDAELLELRKGESLAFKVEMGGGEGYGHQIFSKPELLRNYLASQYNQAIAHKLAFFRSVSVFKTSRENYFKEHPRKETNPYRGVDKSGRSIRRAIKQPARSDYITPWEQGYAAYNSGFEMDDNPWPAPPERRQWQNGYIQAKKDDGK